MRSHRRSCRVSACSPFSVPCHFCLFGSLPPSLGAIEKPSCLLKWALPIFPDAICCFSKLWLPYYWLILWCLKFPGSLTSATFPFLRISVLSLTPSAILSETFFLRPRSWECLSRNCLCEWFQSSSGSGSGLTRSFSMGKQPSWSWQPVTGQPLTQGNKALCTLIS